MTRDELITKIFQAGAAYWKEPGAEKVTYLFSIDELEKLVRMVQPKQSNNPICNSCRWKCQTTSA